MRRPEPFTFGIALIARALAPDWRLALALLDLTLASISAQTDQDFRIVIAGHDRPSTRMDADPRLTFLEAGWPVGQPEPHNVDSSRKLQAISAHVLERGGGLLMFVDADDWVDRRLVEAARSRVGPDEIAAVIRTGFATDLRTLRTAPLPHPRIFDRGFHRICGSSGLMRLDPRAADPIRRNPFPSLQPHHLWIENARANGFNVARLPVPGQYVVNTSQNHSERHGPHAGWRRTFVDGVNREGRPLAPDLARRFGLDLERVRAVSGQLSASPPAP